MDVSEVKEFCLSLNSVTSLERGEPASIITYKVNGRNFAYFKTSEPERWRFSFHVAPERFLELTDIPGVKPARYMARYHWVTVVHVSEFDSEYLKELIKSSYRMACSTLSKKTTGVNRITKL